MGIGRLDMFAGASVAMAAGANFVVETTVDLVLLGPEDGREVVRHPDEKLADYSICEYTGR